MAKIIDNEIFYPITLFPEILDSDIKNCKIFLTRNYLKQSEKNGTAIYSCTTNPEKDKNEIGSDDEVEGEEKKKKCKGLIKTRIVSGKEFVNITYCQNKFHTCKLKNEIPNRIIEKEYKILKNEFKNLYQKNKPKLNDNKNFKVHEKKIENINKSNKKMKEEFEVNERKHSSVVNFGKISLDEHTLVDKKNEKEISNRRKHSSVVNFKKLMKMENKVEEKSDTKDQKSLIKKPGSFFEKFSKKFKKKKKKKERRKKKNDKDDNNLDYNNKEKKKKKKKKKKRSYNRVTLSIGKKLFYSEKDIGLLNNEIEVSTEKAEDIKKQKDYLKEENQKLKSDIEALTLNFVKVKQNFDKQLEMLNIEKQNIKKQKKAVEKKKVDIQFEKPIIKSSLQFLEKKMFYTKKDIKIYDKKISKLIQSETAGKQMKKTFKKLEKMEIFSNECTQIRKPHPFLIKHCSYRGDRTREEIKNEIVQQTFLNSITTNTEEDDLFVKLYGWYEIRDEEKFVLIMEECKCDLFKYFHFLKSRKIKMDFERKIRLIRTISEATLLMHKYERVHRDISPSNIFITLEREKVKIADFESVIKIPYIHIVKKGSPRYFDPKILELNVGKVDPFPKERDIYSLGCIFWYILCEEEPFNKFIKQNHMEFNLYVLPKKLLQFKQIPDMNHKRLRNVPKSFLKIIKSCFDRDETKRPTIPNILKEINLILRIYSKKAVTIGYNSVLPPKAYKKKSNKKTQIL